MGEALNGGYGKKIRGKKIGRGGDVSPALLDGMWGFYGVGLGKCSLLDEGCFVELMGWGCA